MKGHNKSITFSIEHILNPNDHGEKKQCDERILNVDAHPSNQNKKKKTFSIITCSHYRLFTPRRRQSIRQQPTKGKAHSDNTSEITRPPRLVHASYARCSHEDKRNEQDFLRQAYFYQRCCKSLFLFLQYRAKSEFENENYLLALIYTSETISFTFVYQLLNTLVYYYLL